MSEETTTEETTQETTETTTQENIPTPSDDGLFADRENLVLAPDFADKLGDGVRDFAPDLNQRFGNQPLSKFAESWKQADKTISAGGRVIPYPASDAPEAEVAKWRETHGLSGDFKTEDYPLVPQEMAGEVNQEAMEMMAAKLHERGTPLAMAQGIVKDWLGVEQEMMRKANDAHDQEMHNRQKLLEKVWGPEYKSRLESAKAVAVNQGFDPADPDLFDNPKVVGMLMKISGLLGEDTLASMREGAAAAGKLERGGPAEAQRIMTDKNHPDHEAYRQGDGDVAAKVTRLLSGRQS